MGAVIFLTATLFPVSGSSAQSLIAVIAVGTARALPIPAYEWIRYLGGLSLDIYLAHPLVASLMLRLLGEAQFLPTVPGSALLTMALKVMAPRAV